jgi:uncharacterized membrane protein affecting hemolysin expression
MMPWKLLVILAIVVVLALFIGFNLENRCEVSLIFVTIGSVPVYLTILVSFAVGVVAALPFSFKRRKRKIPPQAAANKEKGGDATAADGEKQPQ